MHARKIAFVFVLRNITIIGNLQLSDSIFVPMIEHKANKTQKTVLPSCSNPKEV